MKKITEMLKKREKVNEKVNEVETETNDSKEEDVVKGMRGISLKKILLSVAGLTAIGGTAYLIMNRNSEDFDDSEEDFDDIEDIFDLKETE